jgi:hypothetical protein
MSTCFQFTVKLESVKTKNFGSKRFFFIYLSKVSSRAMHMEEKTTRFLIALYFVLATFCLILWPYNYFCRKEVSCEKYQFSAHQMQKQSDLCRLDEFEGKCVSREKCSDSILKIDVRSNDNDCGDDVNVICCPIASVNYGHCNLQDESDGSCKSRENCAVTTMQIDVRTNDACSDDINIICCPNVNYDADEENYFDSDETDLNHPKILFETSTDSKAPIIQNETTFNNELLNHTDCGRLDLNRIVGGKRAKPADFPFYVALKYEPNSNANGDAKPGFLCGGSLISGL